MTTTLTLTWDGGWSHGCPGEGRIRIDDPNPAKARHILLSVADGGGAHLGELIPSWAIGDAVAVEGQGARLVGLLIGPIVHKGSHYKMPIAVRAVAGVFQAETPVALLHATSADLLTVNGAAPASVVPLASSDVVPGALPVATVPPPVPTGSAASQANPLATELADANAQVAALRDLIDKLLNDPTQIIAAEGQAA